GAGIRRAGGRVPLRQFRFVHLARLRAGACAARGPRAAPDPSTYVGPAVSRRPAVVLRALQRQASRRRHRDAVVAGRVGAIRRGYWLDFATRVTPSAAPINRMNSARWPCGSSPLNRWASASASLNDEAALNSLSRSSMPNSTTAAANPSSGIDCVRSATAVVIRVLMSPSGAL